MKKFLFSVVASLALLFVFVSCASAPTGWLADYEEGQQLASKEGKDLFLFFSSEDTDGVSTQLRTSIFDTESFIQAVGKEYVLVHLDYSESRLAALQLPEDAIEEQKKAAEADLPQLEKDIGTAVNFSVTEAGMPAMILATPQGYVYGVITYNAEVTTPEQFMAVISENNENRDKIKALIQAIDKSTGVDKLNAIDNLYEATDPSYRHLLADLYGMAADLDPNNESGKRGKYAILNAYAVATESLYVGDAHGAISAILAPIAEGFSSPEEQQELYYQAAYFASLIGDSETMFNYLSTALELAPDSEMAAAIQMTIDAYVLSNESDGVTVEGME
jgi:hypothetical protein